MFRSALFILALTLPTAAFADKIVSADGDSFVEVPATSAQRSDSLIDVLSPISPAQAAPAPSFSVRRPAAEVPEMRDTAHEILLHQWDGYYFDAR